MIDSKLVLQMGPITYNDTISWFLVVMNTFHFMNKVNIGSSWSYAFFIKYKKVLLFFHKTELGIIVPHFNIT